MLEINLQRENENLQTSYGLDKRKEKKQNTHVYLLFGAMGHHALCYGEKFLWLGVPQ